MNRVIIGVMGPSQATPTDCRYAYRLGKLIAEAGWVVLTGGRNVGVMDAASRGAKASGGLTVGLLPTTEQGAISRAIDIPILTDMGSARNNINVLSSHVVIACGLGIGTVSEIALALKADKPVVLLNHSPLSVEFFSQLSPHHVFATPTPEEAIALTRSLVPPLP